MLAILISMMTAMHTNKMQAPNKFMPYLSPTTFVFKADKSETNKPIVNPPIETVFGLLKALKHN